MPREFRLPDLGEGLTEAEIVQVLVAEGEEIKEDQAVLLVETEKAQVELPSPYGGRVAQVHVQAGQRVKVGAVLLSLADAAGGTSATAAPAKTARPDAAAAPSAPAGVRPAPEAPATTVRPEPGASRPVTGVAPPPVPVGVAPAATPATRRLARELGVDLGRVRGTGPGGRISDDDVRTAAGRPPSAETPGAPPPASPALPAEPARPLAGPVALPPLPRFEQWGPVEREPLRGIRRRSAEHLALAWAAIPHVTQHDEADVTELETMRRRHQKRGGEGSADLTLTVFLVKAVALALRAHPRFNASLDHATGELVWKRYYNIGVAVDTSQGLLVPVVRGVEGKGIRALAAELSELATRTRAGKATLEDLRGGTFTVTNTGALGGTGATPIINYPEVAILGVGRARLTPVVRDGQVVPRLILPLSLAFDHRVIDGMEAARFSTDLVGLLEAPERLFLEG
jgi:pyruvate dehydrogenase E2 component (dihydrolipoamide acetyltransferase)